MNFKKIYKELQKTVTSFKQLIIFIKGSPDPDVLASSFALKYFCSLYNVNATIVSLMPVSLPQNKALIQKLQIPITFNDEMPDLSKYDGYVILDHQSAFVEKLSTLLPCAIHIDHHEKSDDNIKPAFRLLSSEVGSISTIMANLFQLFEGEIDKSMQKKIATALTYGIHTDTNDLRIATKIDLDALNYLHAYVDKKIFSDVTNIPLSEESITVLSKAIINQTLYKDWIITGVGFLNESYRDSIALIADFLLDREEIRTVAVFAIIENDKKNLYLDVSFRTKDRRFDLNRFIKKITPNGGARHFKGAYQVDLNYFNHYQDRNLLWEIIKQSTIEQIKLQRDKTPFSEVRGFISKIKKFFSPFLPHKLQ